MPRCSQSETRNAPGSTSSQTARHLHTRCGTSISRSPSFANVDDLLGHDFGLRLCQWIDEGMLLRSPTLAEVSQWLLGRFERRWSRIPWCPDATRWSHPPG